RSRVPHRQPGPLSHLFHHLGLVQGTLPPAARLLPARRPRSWYQAQLFQRGSDDEDPDIVVFFVDGEEVEAVALLVILGDGAPEGFPVREGQDRAASRLLRLVELAPRD